jgi:hypothetical protein
MWTPEHWSLFKELEKIYRENFTGEKFGPNFKEFKKHMLYILEVMEHEYGDK